LYFARTAGTPAEGLIERAVDTATTQERLQSARERLRFAMKSSWVPEWLAHSAQQCLIDLDCALEGGLSESRARMLLAQVDALISVVDPGASNSGRGNADSR
jgi:hypothetical protein